MVYIKTRAIYLRRVEWDPNFFKMALRRNAATYCQFRIFINFPHFRKLFWNSAQRVLSELIWRNHLGTKENKLSPAKKTHILQNFCTSFNIFLILDALLSSFIPPTPKKLGWVGYSFRAAKDNCRDEENIENFFLIKLTSMLGEREGQLSIYMMPSISSKYTFVSEPF